METSAHYNAVALNPPDALTWSQRRTEHNLVKLLVLQWLRSRMHGTVTSVCDLACGRGGDIRKLACVFPGAAIVCVDSSDQSIQELERRAQEMRLRVHAVCCDVLRYNMQIGKHDMITMNFALHYFAATKEYMNTLLRNVSLGLRDGGAFAGTCVDWRTLHDASRAGFHVPPGTLDGLEDCPWGRKYRYVLPGCVDLDECVVHFPTLVRLAYQHGLHLVKHRSFNGFLREMGEAPNVPVVNHNYVVFVFRKDANGRE